ncbi:hypothetical protein L1887_15579 [Cichorium endivia]|nr:hypothetical protein L1887_15579 [Cichorium endivia]
MIITKSEAAKVSVVCFPTGKAGMLDEIINYVQSLQKLVELATVNLELDFNNDRVSAKEMLQSPIPSLGCSSETANPTYFQLNSMEELVSYCGLDMIHSMIGNFHSLLQTSDVALFFVGFQQRFVFVHYVISLDQLDNILLFFYLIFSNIFYAQEAALRSLPDIVEATPGRMIDHLLNSMLVDLDDLAVLILDEADRLLELGFEAEICELVMLTQLQNVH